MTSLILIFGVVNLIALARNFFGNCFGQDFRSCKPNDLSILLLLSNDGDIAIQFASVLMLYFNTNHIDIFSCNIEVLGFFKFKLFPNFI